MTESDHSPEPPPRPRPPRRIPEAIVAWVAWFGLGRLVLAAVSVAVVVIGGAWIVRAGPPATESGLPLAGRGAGSSAPSDPTGSTLPQPVAPVTTVAAGPALVHVAGHVNRPGVYTLPLGSRVHDAVMAAGGATADGERDGLNLAALIVDGQRIYVPAEGEVDLGSVSGASSETGDAAVAGPLDLNRASRDELETLPGVGPATAGAIVDDRDRNGPYATVDDLDRVPGIGPAKLAAIRDLVTV